MNKYTAIRQCRDAIRKAKEYGNEQAGRDLKCIVNLIRKSK
jgi:hypothetical protein